MVTIAFATYLSIRPKRSTALDAALDHRAVGDVAGNGQRVRACPFDLGDAVVERHLVTGGDDDLRAAFARETCDRAAEATGGAGDDEHLLAQRLLGHDPAIPEPEDATLRPCFPRLASPGSS